MSRPSDTPDQHSSDTPEIRPALSPDQWKRAKHEWGAIILDEVAATEGDTQRWGMTDHARAALCLHDHPAGFTWEDVSALEDAVITWRAEAGSLDDPATPGANAHERRRYALMLEALAKLAALLPPKEETL